MASMIPQANPKANYLAHQAEIDAAVARVLASGQYILGEEVAAFEREFAAYLGVRHAIGVGSGTEALHLALWACGVGPGDLVFTVSHTAVATVAAIERCGAQPVLVDVEPATLTMDPASLTVAIRQVHGRMGRPKAVVPVHLYGQPVDLTAVLEIARRHDLYVVEDCAQAHGATWQGQKVGRFGHLAAFSFYPTKNLGALGDGGMIVTDDPALAERVRLLREYGWRERYVSDVPGWNSRLDAVQAAVLRVKLRYLDEENGRRRALAELYTALLADSGVGVPGVRAEAGHVYHQYVIRVQDRAALRERLAAVGIGTQVHYPVPIHRQPAYAERAAVWVPLSVTEAAAAEVVSLPMYPELGADEVRLVARQIGEATGRSSVSPSVR